MIRYLSGYLLEVLLREELTEYENDRVRDDLLDYGLESLRLLALRESQELLDLLLGSARLQKGWLRGGGVNGV